MSPPRKEPADERRDLTRVPVEERPNKVAAGDFATPPVAGGSFADFLDSLPHILQADAFRAVAGAVASAARDGRTCLWMLGGHVVKTGLNPILIDLMERGAVTHVAVNGSTVIHDYEACRWGGTSEDVEAGLLGRVRCGDVFGTHPALCLGHLYIHGLSLAERATQKLEQGRAFETQSSAHHRPTAKPFTQDTAYRPTLRLSSRASAGRPRHTAKSHRSQNQSLYTWRRGPQA